MFHWFDTVTNTRGDALAGWQVQLVEVGTQTVVPIFADENSTPIASVSGVTNRAVSDNDGNYYFFVPSGTYSLQFFNPSGVLQRTQRYVPMYGADAANTANLASNDAGKGAALVGTEGSGTVQAGLNARPTSATLAASGGAALIGSTAGTVQSDINARPTSATLAASGGAALVGYTQGASGASTRTVQAKLRDTISVKDFGAVGDGVADDTAALVSAFNAASGKRLVINPGVYRIGTGAQTITLTDDMVIDCADATLLYDNASAFSLLFEAEQVLAPTFTGTVARGAFTINVDSTTNVAPGMLVYINSTKNYETTYNYKQCEVHRVVSTTATSITFSEPVVFPYNAATDGVTVSVRRSVGVTINGPLTLIYPSSGGGTGRILDLRYLTNSTIKGLRSIDPQKRRGFGPDPLLVGESLNTSFRDYYSKGTRYGVNVTNGSRNTSFENVESEECWHPIDFNTAAHGCYVRNIRGRDNTATIQSHPCFDLSYQDVYTFGDEAVVPRAVGVYLRNIRVVTEHAMDGNGFNTDVNLTSDVYSKFDFVIENYTLDAPNASTKQNVVTNKAYRKAVFNSVDTGQIGVGANTNTECFVCGCNVASVLMRGNILYMDKTIIDAAHRQSVGTEAYAFSMANLQGIRASKCEIKGGHSYLFNSPVNAPSEIMFSDCGIFGIATGMFSGTVAGLTGVDILFSNCVGGSNTFDLATTYSGGNRIRATGCAGLSAIEHRKRGSTTASTDGSGILTITHGLYATPTWANAIIQGDNTYDAKIVSLGATTFTVRVSDMAAAGAALASTSVTVLWEAAIA